MLKYNVKYLKHLKNLKNKYLQVIKVMIINLVLKISLIEQKNNIKFNKNLINKQKI